MRSISSAPLEDLCQLAGIKITQVYSMFVDPEYVVINYYLHDEQGRPHIIPGTQDVAASSCRLRIDWRKA